SRADLLPVAQLLLQSRGGPSLTIESRADGTFHFSDVPADTYELRARFGSNQVPDWVAERVSASVTAGQTTSGIRVTASHGGLLELSIIGQKDRQPVPQAFVGVQNAKYWTSVLSDTNGKALLRLPPGEYHVSA